MKRWVRYLIAGLIYAALLALLVRAPFLLVRQPKWITVLILANYFAVFAMSWDILSGYTGQISFGHAFFIGVAGYTSSLLNIYLKLPLWLTIPTGVIAAVLMGLLVAVPALRLRGPYFSLVTLILPIVAIKFVLIFSDFTGGELGKYGLTPLSSTRDFIPHQRINYFYSLGLMVLVAVGLSLIARTKIGKLFEAIRENEEAVEAAGINVSKYKILSFIISSFFAGLGGAFYVHYWGSLIPSTILSLTLSVELIIATIAGGMGTILGPLFGSYLLIGGQEGLKGLGQLSPALGFLKEWDVLVFLILLILLLFFARRGLLPALQGLWGRLFPLPRRAP
ncbi:MAG: branched-chain amino acid ABC transporter permease [Candidatus Bipolaricaulia bacterium]